MKELSTPDPIRALLARVKELDEKATGGPWDVSQGWSPPHWEKDCHYNRIFAGEPNEISGIRKPVASTDGARDHSEASEVTFANAVLMAEYRSLAPQLARALEAVLDTLPDDGYYTEYQQEVYDAIPEHLGGER